MKKRNWIISIVLVSSITSIAISGVANACGGWDGQFRGGGKIMYMMKNLDLSKEQRQTIRSIKNETRDQIELKRDEIHDIRKTMFEQARSDVYDADKIRELASAISQIKVEMIVQRMETMNRIRKELTPEQIAKMDESLTKRIKLDRF